MALAALSLSSARTARTGTFNGSISTIALFTTQHFLFTFLTPPQFVGRLRQRARPRFFPFPSRDKPLQGNISEKRFAIARARWYSNALESRALGTFVPTVVRTNIIIPVGPSPGTIIFVSLVVTLAVSMILFHLASTRTALFVAVLPIIFLGAFIWFGRWLARGESEFLMESLTELLEARLVPTLQFTQGQLQRKTRDWSLMNKRAGINTRKPVNSGDG